MTVNRATKIAMDLMKLGVSNAGVTELLTYHSFDVIERQLEYLPFRKAKRPEAFIIDAVRNNYSPPKEFFYAQAQTEPADLRGQLDENSEPGHRQADAETEGHGAPSAPRTDSPDDRLAPGGPGRRLELPNAHEANRPQL